MAVVINVYGKANLAQIQKAEAQLSGMKRQVVAQQGPWRRFGSVITGTGAKIASGLAAAGLTRWLASSVAVARQSEATMAKLRASVTATGANWDDYEAKMKNVVTTQMAIGAYSGGELKTALATLTQVTGDAQRGFDLLGLSQDLARAKGMDLNKAAQLVGKVAMGNTTSLSRYGIVLEKGATAQEALAAMQKRFAGSAKAYGDTSAGAQAKFNNSLKALQVTVGTALLPSLESLMGGLTKILQGFQKLPGPVQNVIVGVAAVATAGLLIMPFANSIIAVTKAMQLAKVASAAWTAVQWLLNAAMSANPVGLVIIAIAALVAIFVVAWKKSETFRRIVLGAWNAIKSATLSIWNALVNFFKTWGPRVLAVLIGPIGNLVAVLIRNWDKIKSGAVNAFNALVGFLKSIPGRIKDAFVNRLTMLYSIGQDIVRGLVNGIAAAWHWVTDKLRSLIGGLSKTAKKLLGISSPSKVFAQIGNQIGAGLVAGIDATAGQVARAVAGLSEVTVTAAAPALAGAPSGAGSSVVISPGAVQVNVYGGNADAGQIAAAVDPALVRLAREIGRL